MGRTKELLDRIRCNCNIIEDGYCNRACYNLDIEYNEEVDFQHDSDESN